MEAAVVLSDFSVLAYDSDKVSGPMGNAGGMGVEVRGREGSRWKLDIPFLITPPYLDAFLDSTASGFLICSHLLGVAARAEHSHIAIKITEVMNGPKRQGREETVLLSCPPWAVDKLHLSVVGAGEL